MATRPIGIYARVSTGDQHPEAQLVPLREYAARRGVEAVEFVDHGISGRRSSRPALDKMMAAAQRREIGAIAVVRLDRMARSLAHLARLGEELQSLDVALVSLSESIDTSSSTGRALFGLCGVFAQLELDLLKERTIAGLAAARRRGRRLGRPAALDGEKLARARRLRDAGRSLAEIARILGASKSAIFRALRGSVPETLAA